NPNIHSNPGMKIMLRRINQRRATQRGGRPVCPSRICDFRSRGRHTGLPLHGCCAIYSFRSRGRHTGLPLHGCCAIYSKAITPRDRRNVPEVFRRVSGALNLAVGFNPRDSRRNVPASRQRRMNSIVADATWKNNLAYRGLKPTAKFKCRSAAELVKALLLCAMVIGLSASFSICGFGQDLELAQQFVKPANSSNAAQKLVREGRELIGDRKLDAAKTKFENLIRAYPRDKNLDAALYWLAFCLKQQGKPIEANQTLERLIKEYPRSDWYDDARALRLEVA